MKGRFGAVHLIKGSPAQPFSTGGICVRRPLDFYLGFGMSRRSPYVPKTGSCCAASPLHSRTSLATVGESERLRRLVVNCEFVRYDSWCQAHREAKGRSKPPNQDTKAADPLPMAAEHCGRRARLGVKCIQPSSELVAVASEEIERRLVAILVADVAGYSRLIGIDDEGTLARLNAHHAELIEPKIKEHRGRIIRATGDGLLVLFVSVVDALHCAVEIQRAMVQRNAQIPPDSRIEFRMGVNVGD